MSPAITAVRTATTKAVAPCLASCTEKATSLVLDTARRRPEEELGKSGAQYTRQPHTLMPNATRKRLRAQRWRRAAKRSGRCMLRMKPVFLCQSAKPSGLSPVYDLIPRTTLIRLLSLVVLLVTSSIFSSGIRLTTYSHRVVVVAHSSSS